MKLLKIFLLLLMAFETNANINIIVRPRVTYIPIVRQEHRPKKDTVIDSYELISGEGNRIYLLPSEKSCKAYQKDHLGSKCKKLK